MTGSDADRKTDPERRDGDWQKGEKAHMQATGAQPPPTKPPQASADSGASATPPKPDDA